MADVLVLGGGFGGLAGATRLRGLLGEGDTVTVVDRSDRFYMGFAKLWALAGQRSLADGTRLLADLEDTGVGFLQREILTLDPETRVVTTDDGELHADAILVALGAVPAPAHAALLEGPRAHDLYDGEAIDDIRSALAALHGGRVVISILGGPHKCPPAPYEAALIVDRLLRDRGTRDGAEILLTTPKPITLPVAGPDASRFVAEHLDDAGVQLRSEHVVDDVRDDTVVFADGGELTFDLLLGVPAVIPPEPVRDSPLTGDTGFVEPDRHSLRTDFEGVYAVGDCTWIPTATGALPKAGVFAAGEAEVAAANIAADLGRGEPASFDGHGMCFLELPGEQVAFVEGDFYADPLDVTISEADREHFERKLAYERDHLEAWLG